MRSLCIVIISTVLLGCADTHELLRNERDGRLMLDRNASAFISIPKDGVYGGIVYQGSGQNTAQIILAAFSKYFTRVDVARTYGEYKESLDQAKKEGYNYLIYPTILEWEDRATEWSSIPDRVSVKVTVVDVNRDRVVDSVIVKGKSGLATFGGDHPQDLLPKPIEEFTKSLFK